MKHPNMFKEKGQKLIDLVPEFPAFLEVMEISTGHIHKATLHQGILYFLREKQKMSPTGRTVTIREKSIVSPFRLNKHFVKA